MARRRRAAGALELRAARRHDARGGRDQAAVRLALNAACDIDDGVAATI
jgi:hypothetical protein